MTGNEIINSETIIKKAFFEWCRVDNVLIQSGQLLEYVIATDDIYRSWQICFQLYNTDLKLIVFFRQMTFAQLLFSKNFGSVNEVHLLAGFQNIPRFMDQEKKSKLF